MNTILIISGYLLGMLGCWIAVSRTSSIGWVQMLFTCLIWPMTLVIVLWAKYFRRD